MSDPLPPVRTLPPASAATPAGKNNETTLPAGALSRAMFADVVAQVDRKPEPEKKVSTPPATQAGPETDEDEPSETEPGEENLTAEAPAETEEETPAETDEEDLSQTGTGNPELDEALKGLNEDARKHLVDIAQAVANGETTIGQVKRQFKLGKAENEELTQLRTRVQELESRPPTVTSDLPPAVAKLKTAAEVEARMELAEQSARAIEDFLEENPSGGTVGNQEFTRAELIQRKRGFQDELKALPKQAKVIEAQGQLSRAQTEVRQGVIKDYPYYADATNPDTKTAQELLQGTPALQAFPNRDYLALALARGHRELQAEKAARAGKPAAKKPVVQTQRAGVAPAGKPHSAGTAVAKKPSRPVTELVSGVKDRSSLAELLAETGR